MGPTIRTEFDEAAASALYRLTAVELAERFGGTPPLGHWFAYDERGAPIGIAVAATRSDGQAFVTHRVESESAFVPLLVDALRAIDGPVNVTVDAHHVDRAQHLLAMGLTKELSGVRYEVPFAPLLEALPRRRRRDHIEFVGADEVDPDVLFELDTELRRDVPGNDGWRGHREWFDDELSSPEFDATGSRVAIDTDSGDLVGLCRMWRNPDGPALGMLGVRRHRRTGVVALELLRATAIGSAAWGWPTFTTHTARPGLQRHLQRVGATASGGFLRFARR